MSLVLNNIKKRFFDKIIFDGFSYTFSDTGIYAVTGDSGVGKTTLLRMIAGLDNDYDGKIIDGGVKNVSFAFQEYRLFPQLSALDNVMVASSEDNSDTKKEATELLLSLDFDENSINLKPHQLSGGMKQRVNIARAFMKKSSVLIMDEPTKELDRSLRKKLYDMILRESKKRLVIFVSHNIEDIAYLNANTITLGAP